MSQRLCLSAKCEGARLQSEAAGVTGCADQPLAHSSAQAPPACSPHSRAWTWGGRRLTTRTTPKRQVKRDLRDTKQLCWLFSRELYCSRTTGITIHSTAGIFVHIQSLPVSIWKQTGSLKWPKWCYKIWCELSNTPVREGGKKIMLLSLDMVIITHI